MTTPTTTAATEISTTSLVMGSLLQCIRSCLEDEDDEETEEQRQYDLNTPMDRAEESDQCCRPPSENGPLAGIWNRLTNGNYQHIAATSSEDDDDALSNIRRSSRCTKTDCNKSPLRAASSFDSSKDILTIRMEEIVLPGSALQYQMAHKMSESLQNVNHDDECVICMESFSVDNPRMPTLCGCGENKTYFHLPCLYQWMDQSDECPSCRHKIAWEEF